MQLKVWLVDAHLDCGGRQSGLCPLDTVILPPSSHITFGWILSVFSSIFSSVFFTCVCIFVCVFVFFLYLYKVGFSHLVGMNHKNQLTKCASMGRWMHGLHVVEFGLWTKKCKVKSFLGTCPGTCNVTLSLWSPIMSQDKPGSFAVSAQCTLHTA